MTPTRGVDVTVLLELIRQWRAAGGASRLRCADELERVIEVFARSIADHSKDEGPQEG